MNEPLPAQTYDTLQAIIVYKTEHDGVSPSLDELAVAVTMVKSRLSKHISRLCKHGLLTRTPGKSRNLAVAGGQWAWAEPKTFPIGRAGDVLRIVVTYKTDYDGNAPSHRQIAQALGLAYTGDIKTYLDELAEGGYLATAYATDRHIAVAGGRWNYDAAVLQAASGRVPRQGELLPPE
jgi:SOS-response transcriptional repressor LexA